jgi:hypothetical protein
MPTALPRKPAMTTARRRLEYAAKRRAARRVILSMGKRLDQTAAGRVS